MISLLSDFFTPIQSGGWVSWVLLGLGIWLWYGLGYRYFILQDNSKVEEWSAYRQPVQSIIIVAPLLGLLGTVIGMIETFDSLQNQAMYTQGGGIAAGISQALLTTEMGLIVAIPGLLIGKALDRKQERMEEVLP